MSDHTDTLGGRLPLADPAALNPRQRAIFDRMATRIVPWANDAEFQSTAERRPTHRPVQPRTAQSGRHCVLLGSQCRRADAHLAERASPRGRHPGRRRGLAGRLRAVRPLGRWPARPGCPDEAARTIATGEDTRRTQRTTRRSHCGSPRQLSTSHRVDESLYREAENAFGAKGLIDIAFLIGIYHSVCATLTMFAIPAPE